MLPIHNIRAKTINAFRPALIKLFARPLLVKPQPDIRTLAPAKPKELVDVLGLVLNAAGMACKRLGKQMVNRSQFRERLFVFAVAEARTRMIPQPVRRRRES